MLLRVSNLGMSTPTKVLFENVSFVLNEGDSYGIVGPNGCGKTTLLGIILGRIKPDAGVVTNSPNLVVSYMPQLIDDGYASGCVRKLAEAYSHDDLEIEYFSEIMTKLDLWDIVSQENPTFSGGEKTKLALACALGFYANLTILDEPTNFIDLRSVTWLEDFLQRTNRAILTVSHDRAYLDNVVDGILSLTPKGVVYYPGGYSDFTEAVEHEVERQQQLYEAQQAFQSRLEQDIRDTKQQAIRTEKQTHDDHTRRLAKKVAKKAKAREHRLTKMILGDDWIGRPVDRPSVSVQFAARVQRGTLVRTEDLCFSYDGQHEIVRSASIRVEAGEKVVLLGENGSGKTTLLRLIVGELEAQSGVLWKNEAAKIAYFSQGLEELDQNLTVLQAARSGVSASEEETRRVLAGLLLRSEKMSQKVALLSQGEKTKLALARQILKKADLLVLDEFTSHLDLDAIEQIQEAISEYEGAVLFVTHDRYLLETLPVSHYYLIQDGKTRLLLGGLQDYENMIK